MIKRSKALNVMISKKFGNATYGESVCNPLLDALESAGVEFAPEEPNAVEQFNKSRQEAEVYLRDLENEAFDFILSAIRAAEIMRDELLARIAELEKRIEAVSDRELIEQVKPLVRQLVTEIKSETAQSFPLYEEMAAKIKDLEDTKMRHNDWIHKAKNEAGYHDNISFDVVWMDALRALKLHPLPESPELSQAKKIWNKKRCTVGDNYKYFKSETIASHIYITALESELARLRGGK